MTTQQLTTDQIARAPRQAALNYVKLLPIAQRLLRRRRFSEASKVLELAADTMAGHPEREHVLRWAKDARVNAILYSDVSDQIRLDLPPAPLSRTQH